MSTSRGFTLIELLVTLSVLAVIVAIAAPSFTSMVRDNRTQAMLNDLDSALHHARAAAITRRERITLCPVKVNGDGCDDSDDWNHGWLIHNNAGETLQAWRSPSGTAIEISGSAKAVTFQSNGMLIGNSTPTFTACNRGVEQTFQILPTGSISRTKDSCEPSE